MSGEAFGELIAADSRVLAGECHALYSAPAFGSFIRAECLGSATHHFAVVTRVGTGPFDGNRVVQAHGMPPGELEQRKPHLAQVLRTTFDARLVGYAREGARLAGTPPVPPRLHCYVYPAAPEEIADLTRSPHFLRCLLEAPEARAEDLLVAAIRSAAAAHGAGAPLVTWGKYLARLLRQDFLTLEGVLSRLSPPAAAPPPGVPSAGAASAEAQRHPRWEAPLPLAGGRRPGSDPFEEV